MHTWRLQPCQYGRLFCEIMSGEKNMTLKMPYLIFHWLWSFTSIIHFATNAFVIKTQNKTLIWMCMRVSFNNWRMDWGFGLMDGWMKRWIDVWMKNDDDGTDLKNKEFWTLGGMACALKFCQQPFIMTLVRSFLWRALGSVVEWQSTQTQMGSWIALQVTRCVSDSTAH